MPPEHCMLSRVIVLLSYCSGAVCGRNAVRGGECNVGHLCLTPWPDPRVLISTPSNRWYTAVQNVGWQLLSNTIGSCARAPPRMTPCILSISCRRHGGRWHFIFSFLYPFLPACLGSTDAAIFLKLASPRFPPPTFLGLNRGHIT